MQILFSYGIMKKKIKPQNAKVEKKNIRLRWKILLQIIEINEIMSIIKSINKYSYNDNIKDFYNNDIVFNFSQKEKN